MKMCLPAFILAAGKGKRLYPFSCNTPKPMLPLLNKPIIYHSIERLMAAGIIHIGIVIQKNDKITPRYIHRTFPDLQPLFIVQKEALGTAHAVLQVRNYLTTENFLVIAGDSLFSVSYLREFVKTHVEDNNCVTLSLEKMDFNLMKYSSTVDFRDGRILEVREKPQTPDEVLSNLNSAALYMFSKSFFSVLKEIEKTKRDEYELVTAINDTIRQNCRVGGLITKRVCHISTSQDLWYFNLKFLHETQKGKVNGNIIGKNTCIDRSAVIKNSILGNNSVVERKVTLKNTVVLANTVVDRNHVNSLVNPDHFECFTNKKQ
ncbi:MAG: sugar phosphate nucleotidyltransferase [Candidatus Hodarchaeales archaeon]|jgi:NDP-sugar pyrophosphorylase family protein